MRQSRPNSVAWFNDKWGEMLVLIVSLLFYLARLYGFKIETPYGEKHACHKENS